MTDRSGTRCGNVRDLDTARALHEEHKDQWTATVRKAIRETFLAKGQLHADDLAVLEIPSEHQSIIGSQIARLVNRKLIVATDRRKCKHPAANGRKANVYMLTELGREKLAGVGVGAPSSAEGPSRAQVRASSHPGECSPEPSTGSSGGPVRPHEPLSLLPSPDPEAWAT